MPEWVEVTLKRPAKLWDKSLGLFRYQRNWPNCHKTRSPLGFQPKGVETRCTNTPLCSFSIFEFQYALRFGDERKEWAASAGMRIVKEECVQQVGQGVLKCLKYNFLRQILCRVVSEGKEVTTKCYITMIRLTQRL